jgi:hypothetical protein
MNTDFRALCAQMLQPLAEYDSANSYHEHRDLITRARAELAKPRPAGPTRDELRTMAAEFAARTPEEFALAVLARWESPAIEPVPQGPTDEELCKLLYYEFTTSTGHGERVDAIGFALAVLARWGRPAVAPEAGELSPKEVEAQEAFTKMRDEILSRSDGLGVNEVLSVIDNFTPDWV